MNKPNNEIPIARIIYEAYPHADLLPIDPEVDCRDMAALLAKVNRENIGDSLFNFIVVEIAEGGENTLAGAIRVMECAQTDLASILQALRSAAGRPVAPPAMELLDACKTLTSYTMDLLYRLDNQVDLRDVEEIQQAQAAIAHYTRLINNPA